MRLFVCVTRLSTIRLRLCLLHLVANESITVRLNEWGFYTWLKGFLLSDKFWESLIRVVQKITPLMASQPPPPSFSRPPVREALIDIRIDPLPTEIIPKLEALHEKFRDSYPDKKTRYEWKGTFQLVKQEVITSTTSPGPFGFRFETSDKKRAIQIRRDGFTFNQLKPDPSEEWSGWDVIRDEAKQAWDIFVEILPAFPKLTRFAIRYINQIVIPGEHVALEDYLTYAPKMPKELPQVFDHFFSRIEFTNNNPKAKVIVIQTPSPKPYRGNITLTLDIDVIRLEPKQIENDALWQTLDQFRKLKNDIFLASLSKKTKELFL